MKKISSKITLSGLVKLLASTCAYYKICENKDDLIDLIFVHMIHFFCYNQQAIDQVINLIEQVWTGKNRQSRRKIQKHRELETQNLGDVQYVYFIYLAKSGKLNTNFSISFFSNLYAKYYDFILPAINGCKKPYVASAIRYLQRSKDKEKLIRILNTLSDMKQAPIVDISKVTECAGTVIASYFINKITEETLSAFLNYLFA